MSTTDFDQLTDSGRRRLIKFDPTISSGTIVSLVSMLAVADGAWATYQSDKATTRLELDQVKAAATAEKSSTKESFNDIKGDVKEIQRTLVQMNQTLAVMEAKQPKGKP
ncbi:MAG: hypothetical protein ABI605_10820 [Rhizobacter sp.]